MPNPWRAAFFKQAKSDFGTFKLLNRQHVAFCHQLHYLQMATEKLAKGFLCEPSRSKPPNQVHEALLRFLRIAKTMPFLARECGYSPAQFRRFIEGLYSIAEEIEKLAPGASNRPNPEYPWEQNGNVLVPVDYPFAHLNLARPQM